MAHIPLSKQLIVLKEQLEAEKEANIHLRGNLRDMREAYDHLLEESRWQRRWNKQINADREKVYLVYKGGFNNTSIL